MERSCTFHGINVGNTDGVRAVLAPPLRMVVVGDSFTEPTVVDSGGVWTWGWAQYLGAMLGVDAWSCGAGGTGYLNPGSKVKYRDRLADYVTPAPDIIVWAGGINDYAGYTAAAIGTEAAACFAAVKAALPNCQQIVTSPFYPRGNATFPLTLLPARDAIKAAAVAAGLPYVELLELPPPGTLLPAGTVQAATTVGASTISSSTSFPVGAFVRIGSGATQEVRAVSAVSGTGPYTLTVQQNGANLAAAHAIGEPIVQSGPSYVTGTGRQGATAGNGTGDRYTGTDATHPTVEGHLNLALAILPQMRAVISA
jgi:lysophospholipase L1-like esterase